jgi:hypothetical protein
MATRNGKVANLPNDIREQLNLRLLERENGRELVAWLNALPEVQSVLGSQFNASPISEVNLTHWRQGGYLQWFTERECFDSARALADGDCDLAETGFSAERLLNVLTVRFGQLLMRWDLPPDEGVSETVAFSEVARKARILQGISRSVLAIHRIQSRSPDKKSQPSTNTATSRGNSEGHTSPSFPGEAPFRRAQGPERAEGLVEARQEASPATAGCLVPTRREKETSPATTECLTVETKESRGATEDPTPNPFRAPRGRVGGLPKFLSGPICPPSVPLKLAHTPFKADFDLSEILGAV